MALKLVRQAFFCKPSLLLNKYIGLFSAQEYEMNTWYYDLEDLTFKTHFIHLAPEVIDALIDANSNINRQQPKSLQTSTTLAGVSTLDYFTFTMPNQLLVRIRDR